MRVWSREWIVKIKNTYRYVDYVEAWSVHKVHSVRDRLTEFLIREDDPELLSDWHQVFVIWPRHISSFARVFGVDHDEWVMFEVVWRQDISNKTSGRLWRYGKDNWKFRSHWKLLEYEVSNSGDIDAYRRKVRLNYVMKNEPWNEKELHERDT